MLAKLVTRRNSRSSLNLCVIDSNPSVNLGQDTLHGESWANSVASSKSVLSLTIPSFTKALTLSIPFGIFLIFLFPNPNGPGMYNSKHISFSGSVNLPSILAASRPHLFPEFSRYSVG